MDTAAMSTKDLLATQKQRVSYFDRNASWLRPVVVAFIFLIIPAIPGWLSLAGAATAMCTAGAYSAITDTISARIMRVLSIVAVVAIFLAALFI